MLLEQVGWGVRLKVIKLFLVFPPSSNLNVSRIMVKRTNLPRRGTTREVGGMISARRRKNTVRESRMEMEREILHKINSKIRRRMMENKWNDQEMMERSKEEQITFSPLSEGR